MWVTPSYTGMTMMVGAIMRDLFDETTLSQDRRGSKDKDPSF
jgi:hypothetical protein